MFDEYLAHVIDNRIFGNLGLAYLVVVGNAEISILKQSAIFIKWKI